MHYTSEICTAFIHGLGAKFWYKCGGAIILFWLQFSFSGIEYIVIAGIFGMVMVDLFTRVVAEFKKVDIAKDETLLEAVQLGKFNHIKSRKIAKTTVKVLVYSLMIASGSFAEIVIGSTINLPITELIAISIGFTEFYSIIENLRDAGYVVPSIFFKKSKEYVENNLEQVAEITGKK